MKSTLIDKLLYGLLAIVFITLKLTHVIAWSWWWVLAPLWVPTAFALLVMAAIIFVMAMLGLGHIVRIVVKRN